MVNQAYEKRVSFAQFSWPVLMFGTGIIGTVRGVPIWLVCTICLVSTLPIFISALYPLDQKKPSGRAEDIFILSWVMVGLFVMALGGGALSPLTLILLLGPCHALIYGKGNVAIDIALFGLFAYTISITAGFLGWRSFAPAGWVAMTAPLSIAGIVQIVIYFWAFEPRLQPTRTIERTLQPESTDADKSAESVKEAREFNLPLLLIRTESDGQIRDIEGPNILRSADLTKGQSLPAGLKDPNQQTYSGPNGLLFRQLRRSHPAGGEWLMLIPDDVQSEIASDRITALESKAAAAEAALTERTSFFAGLGHDLKTPLNAILGFADLMKAEVRGPLPDVYKDYPAIIHESGQDLMLLVEDILDLAKSEAHAHQLDMEPIDLIASAASIVRQLEDQATRAGVTLQLDQGSEVWAEADARAVRQIWQNLVSNAIKYSKTGGSVILSASRATSGTVSISVKDAGQGMDKADLDRIAKPFAQGKNAKGRAGTGLGLAVVQRFAELHGGKVIIDTAPDKGTRVRVTLPEAEIDDFHPIEDAAQ